MKANKEWDKFREGKTGLEVSKALMGRYVNDHGFDKMCEEFERTKQGLNRSIHLNYRRLEYKYPDLCKAYKGEVMAQKTRSRNKRCTEEWLNIKRRYADNTELARYLMDYYVKFREFKEIEKMSGLTTLRLKTHLIYPYLKKVAEEHPEEVEKFELANVKSRCKRVINKDLIKRNKERILSMEEEEEMARKYGDMLEIFETMPKQIEELKFLDVLCTTNINISVRKIKEIAREKHGIEVYRLDWETGNKVVTN